jgi:hypothetical protein
LFSTFNFNNVNHKTYYTLFINKSDQINGHFILLRLVRIIERLLDY